MFENDVAFISAADLFVYYLEVGFKIRGDVSGIQPVVVFCG